MRGKETLVQYRETEREIAELERELEEWRSRAERVTTSYSMAPGGSGDGRHMEAAVLRLYELAMELVQKVDELVSLRIAAGKIIGTVLDSQLRAVLRLRYIEGQTFQQIADGLGYCHYQIQRQHKKALAMLDES